MTTTTDTPDHKQTLGFQTEVRQLLHLMIHSLYSHREIFLRELVSNASDACDRLRFAAIDAPALFEADAELAIRIDWDPKARTISVADNGIGMSRDEVVANIGTIAKSGTREFVASMSGDAAKDAGLIGQFGVGFYSAFLVADRVTLVTRAAGAPPDQGVRWESVGEGEYTIESDRRGGTGHDGDAASARGHGRVPLAPAACGDRPQVLGSHRHPGADAQGDLGRGDEVARQGRSGGDGQRGVRAVDAAEDRDHRRAVCRVLQARRPRLRGAARARPRQGRGPVRVHATPVRSGARAVRLVGPRASARVEALRAPRVHHGRRAGPASRLPAIRARRRRCERPAAQRVARDPAAVARRRHDSRGLRETHPGAARGARAGDAGEVRDVLDDVRQGAEGRCRRGSGQPRPDREAAAFRVDEDRRADAGREPRRPTSAA